MKPMHAWLAVAIAFALGEVARGQEPLEGWPIALREGLFGYPTVADVDGDGAPEILVPSSRIGLHAFRADGTDLNGWPYTNDEQERQGHHDLQIYEPPCAGDVDGDGELEVAFLSTGLLYVLSADGAIEPGWPIEPAVGIRFSKLALGDLDGDGDLEIIVGLSDHHHTLYAYHGDATIVEGWPADIDIEVDYDEIYIAGIAVGDLDFDGRSEVVPGTYGYLSGNIDAVAVPTTVLNGDGTPREGWPSELPSGPSHRAMLYPCIADLDGDHRCEIIGTSLTWDFFRTEDGGTFYAPEPNANGLPRPPACADLDGDGDLEVIIPKGTLRVYDFDEGVVAETDNESYRRFDGISVGDVDGDGLPEIAAWSKNIGADQSFDVHLMNGDLEDLPGWPKVMVDDTTGVGIVADTCMADLDGDGDAELIYAYKDTVYVWNMERTGEERTRVAWPMLGHDSTQGCYYHTGIVPRHVFLRGDGNRDDSVDVADAGALLNHLFRESETDCPAAFDFDADDELGLADALALLDYLFLAGVPPRTPFPECGLKPDGELLHCLQFECPPDAHAPDAPSFDTLGSGEDRR